jgi:hypothetical protein
MDLAVKKPVCKPNQTTFSPDISHRVEETQKENVANFHLIYHQLAIGS